MHSNLTLQYSSKTIALLQLSNNALTTFDLYMAKVRYTVNSVAINRKTAGTRRRKEQKNKAIQRRQLPLIEDRPE